MATVRAKVSTALPLLLGVPRATKKIRVYGSTANNAVSLARPILLNERFLV